MGGPGRYPAEMHERAVRLVFEQQGAYDSQWEAIESIAAKVGCSAEALRKWVRKAEHAKVKKPTPAAQESARVAELEREVRELRRANEILRKASAYFAQAELDRRPK